MSKTAVSVLVGVALIIVLGIVFLTPGEEAPPVASTPTPTPPTSSPPASPAPLPSPSLTPTPVSGRSPAPPPIGGPAPSSPNSAVVTYTDAGYAPGTLTVRRGAAVTFKNQSSQPMWTASAIHPSHEGYPGTSRSLCGTATFAPMFDSCEGIAPGASWVFMFDQAGSWNYHNHVNAGHRGTIVVQ